MRRRRPLPGRLAVDSCAAEFEARTPYFYLSYETADDGRSRPAGRCSSSAAARTGSARGSSSTTAASARPRPSAGSATRQCSSTRTQRRSRRITTRATASTSSRSLSSAYSTSTRWRAARRRGLPRRPDAARLAGHWRRQACRCSAIRCRRSRTPRTGRFAAHPRRPRPARAAWGAAHDASRGSRRRRPHRLPGARPPALCARRTRHADRARPR